jgi:pyridoxine/pyridoxamine 5'-phosphate oxidase
MKATRVLKMEAHPVVALNFGKELERQVRISGTVKKLLPLKVKPIFILVQ